MRQLSLLAGVAVLCCGCTRGPAGPQKPVNAPDRARTAFDNGVVYLGKPLDYWTQQATAANRQEELDKTVEALTLALGSEKHNTLVTAADALEVMGPEANAAAPALAGQLDHKQPWVRVASMAALTTIGAPAVPALVDSLENGPGNAPIRAAIVLGNIGPAAKDAIPALEKAMEGQMANRRDRLVQIIALIDPDRGGVTPAQTQPAGAAVVPAETSTARLGMSGDWPQFHGPARDSMCSETGLLQQWPEDGPEFLWRLKGLGIGYSTVSIAGGKFFTMGDRPAEGEDRSQFVIAYDLTTRKELWATRVGDPFDDGPRCTPTVDGRLLYAIGTEGNLVCIETATGSVRWQRSFPDDFGGVMMSGWKYSESPLVDGGRLVCTPGGQHATIVALDKLTGETIWKSAVPTSMGKGSGQQGKDGAAYSSVVVAEVDGVRQYVQLLGRGVVGVEADSGRFLWGYNRIANTVANIATPAVRGNLVFVSTSYGGGCALLQINRNGEAFQAEEVYRLAARQFENHHGGVVLVGNHVYAGSGQNKGQPVCLELGTGKIVWKEKALARGSAGVLYADGHLIFRYDRGLVALIEATPEAFRPKGSFLPPAGTGPAWAHPVIHGGKLYLRHNDLLLCYDVRAGTYGSSQ